MKNTDTIGSIKKHIKDVSPKDFQFVSSGKRLDDELTFADNNVQGGSTLLCVRVSHTHVRDIPRDPNVFHIFVRTLHGKDFNYAFNQL